MMSRALLSVAVVYSRDPVYCPADSGDYRDENEVHVQCEMLDGTEE